MDPITRGMQRFADDAEAFWRAHPGRLLPLIANDDDRAWMLQALRLREAASDNRRPFVIYEAPFYAASAYFAKLEDHVAEHYEAVRNGVAEEGVELPPLACDEGTAPSGALKRAAITADRAARLLGEEFDGIVIALVPEHVLDVAAWRESVLVLASARWSPRVRMAVLAPPGGVLAEVVGDDGARLETDGGEVLAFLKGADGEPGEGETATNKLRRLLIDAAAASAAGDHDGAAVIYERAASLCATERMIIEEASVRMALGGLHVAVRALDLAVESYSKAAGLATSHGAWQVACQAWLGAGSAHVARGNDAPAVVAFRAAAEAARNGGLDVLEVEARRMASRCLVRTAEAAADGGNDR